MGREGLAKLRAKRLTNVIASTEKIFAEASACWKVSGSFSDNTDLMTAYMGDIF